jgi:thiol-disulfide isomerase/thioredoxin
MRHLLFGFLSAIGKTGVLLGGLLVVFSMSQSACTQAANSNVPNATIPRSSMAVTTIKKHPAIVAQQQPVQSDLVTVVQPAQLLQLLPLAKTTPVFIDFTSEYCGECKAIAPVLAEAKKRYANRVTFMMIDVQKMIDAPEKTAGKDLMMAFRPMYTPTLIAIKPGGVVVAVASGFKTSPQLDAMLNSALPTVKAVEVKNP